MDPERPTLPPPRRRQEHQDSPQSVPSDSRELVLRQLRDVEARAKAATQRAIADVVEAFERQIAERDSEIEGLRETIRLLQSADTKAVVQLAELAASVSSQVTVEVQRQLAARAAAEGAEAGSEAGRAAGARAGAKWTGAAGFLGAVIAAAVSAGIRGCDAGDDKALPPATQQPVRGPGYGGRP